MPSQYFGKYTGIVKDNADDSKLGILQVSVPAVFPPDEMLAARPALPYGHYFVPEKNAKVWVEFEGGDPSLPLWTGVQYVQGEWPKEAEANPPQLRVIKTAAGHLVIFADKAGDEKIEIREGGQGHVIVLDKDGIKITDGKNKHEIASTSQGITIKQAGSDPSLSLESASATLKTKTATVKIDASGITVDGGPGIVKVTGSTIELSNAAQFPVLRATVDQGIGNLGAPVPLIGPGNPLVKA